MGNIWLIVFREYRQRVRATSFKVTTAIGFVLILGLAFAPTILNSVQSATGGSTIAVVDPGENLSPTLRNALPGKLPNGEPQTKVVAVQSKSNAEKGVKSGKYDGALIPSSSGGKKTSFVYRSPQPGAEADKLRGALSSIVADQRLRDLGLSKQKIAGVFAPASLQVEATGDAPTGQEFQTRFWLVYVLVFMLYLTVIQYGNMVAMGVIGEKSSRITEIMTASVRPFDQMTGKILGVGLLGLTQYAVWISAGLIALLIENFRGGQNSGLAAVSPGVLLLFALCFVLGFLLYAAMLAGLGSLLSRTEDAQQAMMPVIMLLVGGFLLTFVAMANPEGTPAVVGSFIPFFSPLVMFARAVLGSPPAWQVALSLALLAATVAAAVWTAAKVYRTGVLMYGKRPSLMEAARLVWKNG